MSERNDLTTMLEGSDAGSSPIRVCLISLGCPKNLVDSEVILGNLGTDGLAVATDPMDSDVVVINTCGFIESAKEESIQTILEMCELKETPGGPSKVVVAGCLSQRYGRELREEVPEVDAVIGLGEYDGIGALIRGMVEAPGARKVLQLGDPDKACHAEVGRFRLTPPHYAYIKVSEGCDNPCTFCAIPAIRGRFRSKPLPMILEEAEELVASGAREIILISQDTTSYGVDIDGRFGLPTLLERLNDVRGLEWIRVLYAYPAFLNEAMIDAVAGLEKVVNYLDVPLQHIEDTMLRRMGRRFNEAKTRRLLEMLREKVPGIYLRTTFLVGFPGEGEREFAVLRAFVREFAFERLGVFPYSEEEGTPSAGFRNQVPAEIRERRAEEILAVQQENAFRQNRSRKGERIRVLVDGEAESGDGILRCRSYAEAPEVDPCILVPTAAGETRRVDRKLPEKPGFRELPSPRANGQTFGTGEFLDVTISGSRDYDLLAIPALPGG